MSSAVLGRALTRATQLPALTVFAALQLALGLLVALPYLASVHGPLDARGHEVTGDFMAFYAAGRLLERPAELYDLRAQRELQRSLLGRAQPTFQPCLYPPLGVLAMGRLAQLDYASAFRAYAAAMVAALLLGWAALARALPGLGSRPARWTAGLLLLGFHPVLRTAVGGQTSALSVALCMGACAAGVRGRPVLAGALLGLLGYKPQLLVVPLAWLCVARHGRALAGCITVLAAYRPLERGSSLPSHVALWPFVERLVGGLPGTLLGAGVTAAFVGHVLYRLRRGGLDDPRAWAAVLCAGVLGSPHLLHYDVGLAALAGVLSLTVGGECPFRERLALAAGYLGYPLHALSVQLGFQPLTPYLAWLCHWALRRAAPRH